MPHQTLQSGTPYLSAEMDTARDPHQKKVWGCLLTNEGYLRGVLTLHYSLVTSGTKYPFYVIYTEVTLRNHGTTSLNLRP